MIRKTFTPTTCDTKTSGETQRQPIEQNPYNWEQLGEALYYATLAELRLDEMSTEELDHVAEQVAQWAAQTAQTETLRTLMKQWGDPDGGHKQAPKTPNTAGKILQERKNNARTTTPS